LWPDSVAQPVEHNTFNVGVLGSNPSWITFQDEKTKQTPEIQRILGVSVFRQNLKKQRIPARKSGEIGGLDSARILVHRIRF
jgi:hypothetical protein